MTDSAVALATNGSNGDGWEIVQQLDAAGVRGWRSAPVPPSSTTGASNRRPSDQRPSRPDLIAGQLRPGR